eukprot:TRINITY_DN6985_c0_g1_i1.p1 TRINITY_DN6985_c0_g1~~TRINITY_DN6985_c0_g1_i1.p1  ORF type:complete len:467 (+),score=97.32 TRINITY_DN6985_c0_g1_i1:141-1403(+)
MLRSLVGSEMCIRDRYGGWISGHGGGCMATMNFGALGDTCSPTPELSPSPSLNTPTSPQHPYTNPDKALEPSPTIPSSPDSPDSPTSGSKLSPCFQYPQSYKVHEDDNQEPSSPTTCQFSAFQEARAARIKTQADKDALARRIAMLELQEKEMQHHVDQTVSKTNDLIEARKRTELDRARQLAADRMRQVTESALVRRISPPRRQPEQQHPRRPKHHPNKPRVSQQARPVRTAPRRYGEPPDPEFFAEAAGRKKKKKKPKQRPASPEKRAQLERLQRLQQRLHEVEEKVARIPPAQSKKLTHQGRRAHPHTARRPQTAVNTGSGRQAVSSTARLPGSAAHLFAPRPQSARPRSAQAAARVPSPVRSRMVIDTSARACQIAEGEAMLSPELERLIQELKSGTPKSNATTRLPIQAGNRGNG